MKPLAVKLPAVDDRKVVVVASFSGGRSSALACRAAVEAGVADHVVFNNTGLESPETYAFIAEVNREWLDGRLQVLEMRDGGERLLELDGIDYADRTGAPMTELMRARRLPGILNRICTDHLKVKATFEMLYKRYDYKTTKFVSVVGFRAEELNRLARMRMRNEAVAAREDEGKPYLKWTNELVAPLADCGWNSDDVLAAVDGAFPELGFNPADSTIRLSNCRGCFYSNQAEFIRVAQQEPEVAEYWDRLERENYELRGDQLKERPRKIERMRQQGVEPADDYERKAFSSGYLSWSAIKRLAAERKPIPIQPELLHAGGCDDGACGMDI